MQNTRRYFLLVFLVASIVFSVILTTVTGREKVPETPVAQLVPQIFLIIVAKNDGGKIELLLNGTGTLVGRTEGVLATAKHVITPLKKGPNYTAYALRNGVYYPLEVSWEHPVADIAVLHFRPGYKPERLPKPFVVANSVPSSGAKAALFGYLSQEIPSQLRACEKLRKIFVCEKGFPLTVDLPRVPISQLSLRGALEEFRSLLEHEERYPTASAEKKELSRSIYVTALLSESDRGKEYYGMSGGALLDERGEFLGIFTAFTESHTLFVAADEIPEEFLSDTPK